MMYFWDIVAYLSTIVGINVKFKSEYIWNFIILMHDCKFEIQLKFSSCAGFQ